MKQFFTISILFFALVSFLSVPSSRAEEMYPSSQTFAGDLIAQIRDDPLLYAESLGYDRDTLVNDLPWLADGLENGFEECTGDDGLMEEAGFLNLGTPGNSSGENGNSSGENGNNSSGENGNNSSGENGNSSGENGTVPESGNGEYPGDDYALFQEKGGVVSFYNFMSSDRALRIVIESLFKEELDPFYGSQRVLLNSEFTLFGVSLTMGKEVRDNGTLNAYYITICFGSEYQTSEMQVLNMVNQVRFDPMSVFNYIDESFETLSKGNKDVVNALWLVRYSPLHKNALLYSEGKRSSFDHMENFSGESFSGSSSLFSGSSTLFSGSSSLFSGTPTLTASDNEETNPFDPMDIDSYGVELVHDEDAARSDISSEIFSKLALGGLEALPDETALFDPDNDQAGVGIQTVQDGEGRVLSCTTLKTATVRSEDPMTGDSLGGVGVYGLVYTDTDENGVYTAGEGQNGQPVIVTRVLDGKIVKKVHTDNTGHFAVDLEKDYAYQFTISSGSRTVIIGDFIERPLFLPVKIVPALEES